jgi:hypothetical protein
MHVYLLFNANAGAPLTPIYTPTNTNTPAHPHIHSTWLLTMGVVSALVAAYTASRVRQLQAMRTSTSTTTDGSGRGDGALVARAARLLRSDWRTFEAPTVIHYAAGQRLAPHFDANRAATIEVCALTQRHVALDVAQNKQ